ncbi:MAG: helix-turn-helix transcriptional regulator [Chitinophaga sp.]|uniref:helix-turn-helix domain-containing protein n=1 Tax=Chitinophaga sp. TaxID=1869181 RepID=UPI0025C6D81C|nr:AraC family transcriptional regulator [Chitinophaga sp.]MBV8255146.1 helix-turn-helix transcriptional regulator [Chitinophaga sp.]
MNQHTQTENILDHIVALIEEIYNDNCQIKDGFNLGDYIQSRLSVSPEEVAPWFVDRYEKTIQQYAMEVRVNKVKELLVYTDLSLNEIACKLGYTSMEMMSEELIQLTGLPISFFQNIKLQKAATASNQRTRNTQL